MGTPSFRSLCRTAPRERGSRPWPGAPGRVPPAPPACGPTPCPPCAAAVPPPAPSRPCRPCRVMWRPRPRLSARPGQVGRLRCSGAPFRAARPSPQAGRFAGLAPLLPLAGCGVGAPARPGPHGVGAVGPSAPPARAAALRPALPARPRLRRRPCRAALPAHSPHGVAAPRGSCFGAPPARTKPPLGRSPPCGRLAHCAACAACSARAVRGPQSIPPRALAAQAPPSRASRAAGRRERRLRAGCRPVSRPARPRQAPCRPGQPGHDQRPCLPVSRAAWETVAGVPACAGSPPAFHSGVLVVFVLVAVCCRVSRSPSGPLFWLSVVSPGAAQSAFPLFRWVSSPASRSLFPSAAVASACLRAAVACPGWPGGSSGAVRRRARARLVLVSVPGSAAGAGSWSGAFGRSVPGLGVVCPSVWVRRLWPGA